MFSPLLHLLLLPLCSFSPFSSFIIICSHYTIWTKSWDCPYSSICSNSDAFKRAFFFTVPGFFILFIIQFKLRLILGFSTVIQFCGCTSLIYILLDCEPISRARNKFLSSEHFKTLLVQFFWSLLKAFFFLFSSLILCYYIIRIKVWFDLSFLLNHLPFLII